MFSYKPALLLAAAAVLSLSACGPPPSEEENGGIEQQDQSMPVEPDGGIGDGVLPLDEAQSGAIPMAFRGNWGVNAADCEGGAAAKGLLEIDAETLTFYESVGTLGETISDEPGSMQAIFAFEGEGMEWTREMRLETADNGEELVRRELGDGAMPGAFRYRKCS